VKRSEMIDRLIAARAQFSPGDRTASLRKAEAEGGCGVIGIASSVPIAGRHLLQSLFQMRNRGNGKGGGAALVGLQASDFGVAQETLLRDYLLNIAYLDGSVRGEVERAFIDPAFEIDHVFEFGHDPSIQLDVTPPEAVVYFVRPRAEAVARFSAEHHLAGLPEMAVEEELIFQNSYQLNRTYYSSLGEKRAFVLSHGKDMLVLKLVGYGHDVFSVYRLNHFRANVWIGHHRYPTKGRVWHPGGAHPFVGMHDALVHNGDFANYASVCTYLAQHNLYPLFLTDTEVSVLMFDLLHRTFGYPLEYVIEALAPTTERDLAMVPDDKRDIYRMLQTVHIHGSPDGPWFFLIAGSAPNGSGRRVARLIGITDTSMLRPQVFALQRGGEGEPAVGFAASEKQAIDAALESLSADDPRFNPRPDLIWNARGGSHTDGGAFIFDVQTNGDGSSQLMCTDKFGREIDIQDGGLPYRRASSATGTRSRVLEPEGSGAEVFKRVVREIPGWDYPAFESFLESLVQAASDVEGRHRAMDALTLLVDRHYATGRLRPSSVRSMCDSALGRVFASIADSPSSAFAFTVAPGSIPQPSGAEQAIVIDARGFEVEGPGSLAYTLREITRVGYQRLIVTHAHGHRFIANGLGVGTEGVRIDVYGSPGDYLASGIDGAEVHVHANGQDQLAQIMKAGKLVVHGDVGQTFMYAAKGGYAFVMGNAAGRPLINAVGKPRVVINGTCLDYLAESFMAGDPMNGGGFAIVNGIAFGRDGAIVDLDTPYPGGNLFSLASGGGLFLRDPYSRVGDEQLNGGNFAEFTDKHWGLIRPMLEENERLFGIPISRLLSVDGKPLRPERVYRVILPTGHKALQPEEAWVAHAGN
jgi:glutamate synthase domain-containing protein 1/glutamate synthase domain-containing protein 3